jgi:hypothetical protein
MNNEIFYNISKIIERDSKSSTYKYALLRGVIDIIQDDSPYISFMNDRVQIPTGLLIEKWLLYYYPILQSQTLIPQINGENNLAFSIQLSKLISDYESRGGFSVFYNDLKNKGIPADLQSDFFELAKKLRDTITKMPMKYIGRSIANDYYSIFKYENHKLKRHSNIDIETLIKDFGTFSIPLEYYESFKILGSFINGQDSILFKWAEFSVNASKKSLTFDKAINEVIKGPITEREIRDSRSLYVNILKNEGKCNCVWTGENIISMVEMNIDHVIPFSIWKNNDLWNLLPATRKVNNQKLDKIPSSKIIESRKQQILEYWELIYSNQHGRFEKEIQVALLGNHSIDTWRTIGIEQLKRRCNFLIENRGFEEWKI